MLSDKKVHFKNDKSLFPLHCLMTTLTPMISSDPGPANYTKPAFLSHSLRLYSTLQSVNREEILHHLVTLMEEIITLHLPFVFVTLPVTSHFKFAFVNKFS